MANLAKGALAGIVGTATATILYCVVPRFEGVIRRGYFDPVGIATRCSGDTHDVIVGQTYSEAECWASLNQQLIAHADAVLQCTPVLSGHPHQLAAAVSFAYNIGGRNYCASTVAKRFRERNWKGACRAMNEADDGRAQWVTSRGRVLPGLVKRRAEERSLCERDL